MTLEVLTSTCAPSIIFELNNSNTNGYSLLRFTLWQPFFQAIYTYNSLVLIHLHEAGIARTLI